MKKITLLFVLILSYFAPEFIHAQVQDFENTAVGNIPTGWAKYQSQTDDPGFSVSDQTGIAHSGTHFMAHFATDIATESTSWVVSSGFYVGNAYEMSFFWRGKWSFSYNFSGVYISTTSGDPVANPNDFTLLEEFSPSNYPDTWLQWNEASYDLSQYQGQVVYVAFKYVGDNAHDFYIDDVNVGPMPYCNVPTNLEVAGNTNDHTTLDVTWTPVVGVNNYEIVWGAPGFDPNASGVSSAQVTGSSYTITGLQESTTYEVYIRSLCSSYNMSSWEGPGIATTAGPPPANDECDAAYQVIVNTDGSCTHVTHGSTAYATTSPQPDDVTGTPDNDVWFTFIAANDTEKISLLNVTAVVGSSTDMGMGLYDGSAGCSALTLVQDSDPNSMNVSGLTVGNVYYLRVYGWSSGPGAQTEFDVCVKNPPTPPANDLCDNASEIVNLPYSITENAEGATNNNGFITVCSNYSMNDGVWFSFVPMNDGTVDITVTPNNWDPELQVYSGTDCSSLSCVDHVDSGFNGDAESLSVNVTTATRYWINIGHYSGYTDGQEGVFDLLLTSNNVTLTTSENEIKGLKYYPNPVNNILNISAENNIHSLQIMDLSGKTIYSDVPEKNHYSVDFSSWKKGMYFVRLEVDNTSSAFKIIKK